MKHCSQCGFTFDDRQPICDFDGTELSIVPEMPPSFKTVSFAPAGSPSFVRRLVNSRAGVPALALAGVMLSALLIGYYDSVTQANIDTSVSQTRNDTASTFKPTQVDTAGQVEKQADRPRIISTQRRIGADELPSSMVKRLLEGTRSRSNKSRRGPSTKKLVASKRGPSSSKLAVSKRKAENANRQSQARNQSRAGSRDRVRRQHTARVAGGQPGWRGAGSTKSNRQSQARNQARPDSRTRSRQQHSVARVANVQPRLGANESAHHRKDSKVIAILKKTGSILKRPFEMIGDR